MKISRRAVLCAPAVLAGRGRAQGRGPLHRTVELDVGGSAEVTLSDGSKARLLLLKTVFRQDTIRGALREARVRVKVNGQEAWLGSGNYRLPVEVGGIQIDCPAVGRLAADASNSGWALSKAARFRCWPAGSPWFEPGAFELPVRMRWFASDTQMGNEPTYVNGGDIPALERIYYHNDLDFGGAEGLEEVNAATDAIVVSARGEALPGLGDSPVRPRQDVVYLRDERGWFYRYSHHQEIDGAIRPGARVRQGQRIGLLGKEGGAGWTHLHFGAMAPQPTGAWGTEDLYPFAWEVYVRRHKPRVIAVARPHHLLNVGEEAELDASRSWSAAGRITGYEWTFSNGSRASGARVRRRYDRIGTFTEMVKVTGADGHSAYDFTVVQVLDRARIPPAEGGKTKWHLYPPAIHAVYRPTLDLQPGREITFRVFTFRTREAEETWDFGDGSPPVKTKSRPAGSYLLTAGDYAETKHRFAKPGDYIVRVESRNERSETANACLWAPVRA